MYKKLFLHLLLTTSLLFSHLALALNKSDKELLAAARAGNVERVKHLLDRGADPNAESKNCDNTPLINAGHQTSLKVYELLIEAGANINQTNSCNKWSPLMSAVRYKAPTSAIRLLLEKGAHTSLKSGDGWRPLRIALWAPDGSRADAAALLLQHGAPVDDKFEKDEKNLLMLAIKTAGEESVSFPVIKDLIDRGVDVHALTNDGWNAQLFNGRYMRSAAVAKLLASRDVDMHQVSKGGWNGLHFLARYGADATDEYVQTILDQGHSVDQPTERGYTPLMLTAFSGDARITRLLLEKGADRSTKRDGMTALDYARKEKAASVVAVFETDERHKLVTARMERDSKLPLPVRRDKYMIALTENLKQEKYHDSLLYFELLDQLEIELSDSFFYFWGEALFKTGQPESALEKLYAYLGKVGSEGQYYTQALTLSNQVEEAL